jgi:ferritin-like metal-binding protein YciE
MKITSLEDLLLDGLKDLYSAESQLIKALPRMAKAASSEELRRAFEEHLEQTRGQLERLDQVFEHLGARGKGKKCVAMEGLIEESKELMEQDVDEQVMDAGLIAAAQKVEHYEIASYGTCRTWAQQLEQNEIADLLQQTLDEEKQTDQKLTELAESMANPKAEEAQEVGEEAVVGAGASSGRGNGRTQASRGGRSGGNNARGRRRS